MNPEKRRFYLNKYLEIAQTGSWGQQTDMAGPVAQNSKYYGELEDINDGVRATADHPHHPVSDLRSSLAMSWMGLRKIIREIKTNHM
ncbi:MAG: hypothetical protein A3B44_01860 [Candidatus Levybacteria bacterium RIFCSPLOWO2_01_FULL_38_21]|nr:MAG: hypothetical protein A3B44_01860 [Candidatus Levybacteria bacterium RIFCSPLOWO2_01_FULL_38_21]